jgi:hypothetical protein
MKSFTRLILTTFAMLTLTLSAAWAQVSITATGGTATGSYATVSAAFAAINAGTHQGVINITITANTTEPAAVVALLGSGGYVKLHGGQHQAFWQRNSKLCCNANY